ncbi:MAG: GAF domain-containing protein [Spirochaetales bacterium]|jgi:HD-GYP domain-containing protein (c-di-GMP phosphodiesterase class II)|nr:GAF domain-containing protein [Spirochaetales bacterium]
MTTTILESIPEDTGRDFVPCPRQKKTQSDLLAAIKEIQYIRDLDTLLENILHEARMLTGADAGTIYLEAGGRLFFSYIQNDTLFGKGHSKNKYLCGVSSMPVNKSSIAGYAALSGESLLIDDVYDIISPVSYNFNPSIDQFSTYHTQSLLAVPLITCAGTVVGVLQLINAKDTEERTVPFSMQDRLVISQFAATAADALEKSKLAREMILRLVDTLEFRDPRENSCHAHRVASYAVELYEEWAGCRGIDPHELRIKKDHLRTAAMLHDLGKTGVDASVLCGSSLDGNEDYQNKMHTVYGARFFHRFTSPWDKTAYDVAIGHHEHWAGTGYPGRVNIFSDKPVFGAGRRGKEIPLAARIVAIADTFDTLVAHNEDERFDEGAYKLIAERSGSWFDSELVQIFLGQKDSLTAIRKAHCETR